MMGVVISNRQPSVGEERDATIIPVLVGIWEGNYRVCGARKLCKTAVRAGHDIGRDRIARLMGIGGMQGARRGKRVRTTRPDAVAARHPDLVGRDFTAAAPNQLWVVDLTFVATWAGVAYVCFITDRGCNQPPERVSRRIAARRSGPAVERVLDPTGAEVLSEAVGLATRVAPFQKLKDVRSRLPT